MACTYKVEILLNLLSDIVNKTIMYIIKQIFSVSYLVTNETYFQMLKC